MTHGTVLGKGSLRMGWISRSAVILEMTGDTGGRSPSELATGMALRAIERSMRTHKRKPGEFSMVKSLGPAVKTVTSAALC